MLAFPSIIGKDRRKVVDIPSYLPVGIVEVSRPAQATLAGDVSPGVVPIVDSIAWLVSILAVCLTSC